MDLLANEDEKSEHDDEYAELKFLFDHHQDGSPYYDHLLGFQSESELRYTEEWAKEMNKRDPSIIIADLEPNPSDPPDVFAKMNGKKIGIEVTKLVATHDYMSYAFDNTQNKLVNPKYHPADPKSIERPWSLELFRKQLEGIIKIKDRKSPKASDVYQQYLLIPTHQILLCEAILSEYLDGYAIDRPRNFDAVFILGDHMPGEGDSGIRRNERGSENSGYEIVGPNQREGYHPLFEVRYTED